MLIIDMSYGHAGEILVVKMRLFFDMTKKIINILFVPN